MSSISSSLSMILVSSFASFISESVISRENRLIRRLSSVRSFIWRGRLKEGDLSKTCSDFRRGVGINIWIGINVFSPQCCLIFSWIELEMLLRCCIIHISIILRRFLYLLYLRKCQDLGLFVSYLFSFFIFIFIFIMINRIISWIQIHLFLGLYFRICPVIF